MAEGIAVKVAVDAEQPFKTELEFIRNGEQVQVHLIAAGTVADVGSVQLDALDWAVQALQE